VGEVLSALGINPTYLLSQAVNFLILFGLLTALMWKPAMRRLEARREMARRQREDAEATTQTRARIEQERSGVLGEAQAEADRLLAEARQQTRETSDRLLAEARQKAEQMIAQARKDAEDERNRLLSQMREQIAALAIAAAHQLVGDALDERRQRALVDGFFSGLRDGRVELLPADVGRVEGPVIVTSAIPLNEAERQSVSKDLTSRLGGPVTFQVDPKILGGLMIRVGDRVIDGSMASQLEQLRQTLV
jgi:F-type H+-transporting ATPase subunit b